MGAKRLTFSCRERRKTNVCQVLCPRKAPTLLDALVLPSSRERISDGVVVH